MAERLKGDKRHSGVVLPASSRPSTQYLPHPAVVRALTAPVGQSINGRDDGDDSATASEAQAQAPPQVPGKQDAEARTRPSPLKTSRTLPLGSHPADGGSSVTAHGQDVYKTSTRGTQGAAAAAPPPVDGSAESSAIDPLSQHIIMRTNTQKSIPLKLLGRASYEAEAGGTDTHSAVEQASTRGDGTLTPRPTKEKKKGVSFLSRIIGNKKRDSLSDADDDVSVLEENRMDTAAFNQQPIGFIPRFPPPPKYVRVRAHHKKERTFNRVFVAQELDGADLRPSSPKSSTVSQPGGSSGRAVWALEVSNDGKYLAAAGQDGKVRVWTVLASADERHEVELEQETPPEDRGPPRLKAPVFRSNPIQEYQGHTGSVLALSWSKNNFLLSSSMDKTVRLWHVSRPECLCCFKHSDFVTSIQFHPRDDRFFLAGSLDTKLRLWSIPDKTVAFVTTVSDMVTAVAFTPDGRHSIAGCLNGLCYIYETDGLKPTGQIHVRSARGRNAKGSKITGIDTINVPPDDPDGEVKLLITSNDSRIRLYSLRGGGIMEAKFRGNENTCSQIRASFSDDGRYVICGSEDRKTYVWPTAAVDREANKSPPFEVLDTQSAMVTAAIMVPVKTKRILGASEDPIYDLCNPPPITLVSQVELTTKENRSPTDKPSDTGETTTPASVTDQSVQQQSPAYITRAAHPQGNIFIVADYSGRIKVLRQDCAHQKRRYDPWETGSMRRLLRHSNSARHSIASSIGKESSHKTPSERILSWRSSVTANDSASINGSRHSIHTSRTRSPSPQKSEVLRSSSPKSLPLRVREMPQSASQSSLPRDSLTHSTNSKRSSVAAAPPTVTILANRPTTTTTDDKPPPPPTTTTTWASSEHNNDNDSSGSFAFWKKIKHDALAVRSLKPSQFLDPNSSTTTGSRKLSTASALSSDYASSYYEEGDDGGEVLKCENCRGTKFQASKMKGGKQRLVCVRCHRPVN